MSNMRNIPGDDGAWLPVEEAKSRGLVVPLMEDLLDNYENPPLHPVTARAVQAALVVSADRPMPGVLLADGSVLVLSWEQAAALGAAFREFKRVIAPAERDAFGPTRASMELPA